MNNVNKYGYKKGDSFKVIIADDFSVGDVVTLVKDDGTVCPLFRNQHGHEAFEYYINLELITETNPVEIAKANLAKAQAELDAAVKAEEDSKKFQESDIRSLMVVSASKTSDDLRLVVIGHGGAYWFDKNGEQTNNCHKDKAAILRDLKHGYYKTTKTLKDFANS